MFRLAGRCAKEPSNETFSACDAGLNKRVALRASVWGCALGMALIGGGASAASNVDLVVNPPSPPAAQPVTAAKHPSALKEIVLEAKRGEALKVEAIVSNRGPADSQPFDVRIYLADRDDGKDVVHELDIVKRLSVPGNGQVSIKHEYVMPVYPLVGGRSYWLVAEADTHRDVAERDEDNNRSVIAIVSVPCDDLEKAEYVNEYQCPKFGEND